MIRNKFITKKIYFMAVIQKKFVAMDINSGHKNYIFNNVIKITEIKKKVSQKKYNKIIFELNDYFDELNRSNEWKKVIYYKLISKLVKKVEYIIQDLKINEIISKTESDQEIDNEISNQLHEFLIIQNNYKKTG